jgi:hypothetical protein
LSHVEFLHPTRPPYAYMDGDHMFEAHIDT